MIYITKEDLIDIIQENLLDDSIQLNDNIIDSIEEKAIAMAVSYISGRYQTNKIFDTNAPIRHPLLVQAISMITVYRIVRRNAARKVPEDYRLIYDEALKILENIQAGKQRLDTLPEISKIDNQGNPTNLMWGNATNRDNFI